METQQAGDCDEDRKCRAAGEQFPVSGRPYLSKRKREREKKRDNRDACRRLLLLGVQVTTPRAAMQDLIQSDIIYYSKIESIAIPITAFLS